MPNRTSIPSWYALPSTGLVVLSALVASASCRHAGGDSDVKQPARPFSADAGSSPVPRHDDTTTGEPIGPITGVTTPSAAALSAHDVGGNPGDPGAGGAFGPGGVGPGGAAGMGGRAPIGR